MDTLWTIHVLHMCARKVVKEKNIDKVAWQQECLQSRLKTIYVDDNIFIPWELFLWINQFCHQTPKRKGT